MGAGQSKNNPSVHRFPKKTLPFSFLEQVGLTVLCCFWQKLSRPALKRAVSKRVRDVVGRYKGRVIHWDVVNEALHGPYMEEKLNDRNFQASMFRLVDQVDPIVQKFINDYNVIEYYNDPDSSASKVIEVRNVYRFLNLTCT